VVDDQDRPGGALLAEPDGFSRGRTLAQAAVAAGARLRLSSNAIAFYPEDTVPAAPADGPPGVLAVATPDGLATVAARRYLYATGTYDQNLAFPDNDRPGVLAARAVGRLAFRWGVRPGRRVVVLTDGVVPGYVPRLTDGLADAGVAVTTAELRDGVPRLDLTRDVLAVAALPSPASELPRQHGAEVRFYGERGGFVPLVDARGETRVPHVFAAGDVTGYVGPDAAETAGAVAGAAIAASLGK
jgi:hypothetical protein